MKAVLTGHTRGLGAAIAANLLGRAISVLGLARHQNGALGARFPATLELTLFTLVPLVGRGVWLGGWAAVRRNKLADSLIRSLSVLGFSVPSFVLGVWLLVIFYGALNVFPGTGNISNDSAVLMLTGSNALPRGANAIRP